MVRLGDFILNYNLRRANPFIIVLLFVMAILLSSVLSLNYGYAGYKQSHDFYDKQQHILADKHQVYSELESKINYLKTQEGQESLARQYGQVKNNEHLVIWI